MPGANAQKVVVAMSSGSLRWGGFSSSSRSMSPEVSLAPQPLWLLGDGTSQSNQVHVERYSLAVEQINRWRDLIKTHYDQGIPMENLLLCRLVNFLGQLVPLIRHLSEANMDLCVFCRNNNETFEMYTSHKVKDRAGRVICPVLRRFVCPLCSATGDYAHTIRYCPLSGNANVAFAGRDVRASPTAISRTGSGAVHRVLCRNSDNPGALVDQMLLEMCSSLSLN